MIRARSISLNVTISLLAATCSLLAALVVVPPDAFAAYSGKLWLLVLASLAIGLALWVRPDLFLGASVVALAVSSAVTPVNVASMKWYTYDILLFLVLLRAVLPRARQHQAVRILDPAVAGPVGLWIVVMLIAGLRGSLAGNHIGTIARLETPLVYFPLFCWGFTRSLRESSASLPRVIKAIAITGLGLIAYAAYARITHHRFGNSVGSGIGIVPTTSGDLRRDYGFFSAFQVYPLLTLGAFAYLFFSRRSRLSPTLVAGVGLAATLLTLVRGLIFGLVAGVIWLVVLSVKRRWHTNLGLRLLPLVVLLAACGALFFIFSPVAAHGVAERVLPGILVQAKVATGNTDYRVHALAIAGHIALNHPVGLGFLAPDDLARAGFLPIYLPDTQWGALLVYTGWPGVLALVWAGLALVRRSFQLPANAPWLHPLVAATGLLLLVQGFGWNVLGQTWSLGMIALILALRLGLAAERGAIRGRPHPDVARSEAESSGGTRAYA